MRAEPDFEAAKFKSFAANIERIRCYLQFFVNFCSIFFVKKSSSYNLMYSN